MGLGLRRCKPRQRDYPVGYKRRHPSKGKQARGRGMAAPTTRTLEEMRDIIEHEMRPIYDRTEEVDDIREVLELERAMVLEWERREMDARAIIRDTIDRLEKRQRAIIEPSEEEFLAKVRGLEHERTQATSHIQELAQEVAAREREIERMQVAVEETQAEIENTVDAHIMEMPRVQNAIGLYTNITRIKWNYDTEGEITAGWLMPPEAGGGVRGANGAAVVEGFQFDAAGKDDFEVANKLWDIIDGKARAMVEA